MEVCVNFTLKVEINGRRNYRVQLKLEDGKVTTTLVQNPSFDLFSFEQTEIDFHSNMLVWTQVCCILHECFPRQHILIQTFYIL